MPRVIACCAAELEEIARDRSRLTTSLPPFQYVARLCVISISLEGFIEHTERLKRDCNHGFASEYEVRPGTRHPNINTSTSPTPLSSQTCHSLLPMSRLTSSFAFNSNA